MQVLDRLEQEYAKQGLVVLAVEGEGAAPDQVLERVEKLRTIGISPRFVLVPDPGGRIARQFGVEQTPEIFLLDGAGRVVVHLEGFGSGEEAVLERSLKEVFGIAAPPAPRVVAEPEPADVAEPGAAPIVEREPPADPQAALLERYRYFGNYSLNRGDAAKAEEYFRKYVELAPDDAEAWLRVGEACVRQRRYDEAREAWEQVLRIEPGHAEADANIRRLIRGEY
jgi:tetratricopeptide (TPR) repeat protein